MRYILSFQFTCHVLRLTLALGSSYLRNGMILAPCKRCARDNSPIRDNFILTLIIKIPSKMFLIGHIFALVKKYFE